MLERRYLLFFLGLFLLGFPAHSHALTAPPGFQVQIVANGLALPTQMAFAPDGSIYVAEKNGAVKHWKNGAFSTAITLSDVNNYGDHGLLGMALDPNFTANGYMYLLYTYENSPGFNYSGSKTERLVRVTVGSNDTASESSEVILMGTVGGDKDHPSCSFFPTTSDCMPEDSETHGGGKLMFGPDGKLYVSLGDSARFDIADPNALRALDLDALAGKIMRINSDGTAPADNPFYNGDPRANRSKVWMYGFRNPFRFSFRPGTNTLYVGDVGWYTWEEVDVGTKGGNYGWPCREGLVAVPEYNCATANYIDPIFVYDHNSGTGSVVGGAFPAGSAYPAQYANSFFVGDYSQDVIRRLSVDASDHLVSAETFITGAGGPVDFVTGPDGSIYYLGIYGGDIRRIVYSTGNQPPRAAASGNPTTSTALPLLVHFSSAGSSDPEGATLSYLWNFGDGTTSTAPNPDHSYGASGVYTATLTVSDGQGGSATATVNVRAGLPPPAVAPHAASTAVDPNPSLIGRSALITTNITNSGDAGNINVDFEVYDSAGAKVAQKVYEKEPLGAGASRAFTFNWMPPTVGTYRAAVGIFYSDWSGMYEWTNNAVTFDVLNRAPSAAFAPAYSSTSVTPATVAPGQTSDIQVSVSNSGAAGAALVDIEVYDAAGTKVGQKFFDTAAFDEGATRAFGFQFTPQAAGQYRVAVGIFKPAWAGLYGWMNDAARLAADPGAGGAPLSVYADALASGWENWSWDTTVDFSATPAAGGSFALKAAPASPWAGLYFHHAPLSLAGKSALVFSIRGAALGGQALQAVFFDENGAALPAKSLSAYLPGGPSAAVWSNIVMPLADAGVSGRTITGFALQGADGKVQNAYLLDEVALR